MDLVAHDHAELSTQSFATNCLASIHAITLLWPDLPPDRVKPLPSVCAVATPTHADTKAARTLTQPRIMTSIRGGRAETSSCKRGNRLMYLRLVRFTLSEAGRSRAQTMA